MRFIHPMHWDALVTLARLGGPMIDQLPEVPSECTHVHVVAVVFTDGFMLKAFETCDHKLGNDALIARARRIWGELHIDEPWCPEPDVMDIVRYTRELPCVS